MGSKKALAPVISHIISERHPKATVLDVFAGMCAVGTQVAARHRLFTNDIHAYAATIASALFAGAATGPTSIVAKDELLRHFSENKKALEASVPGRLRLEDQLFGSNGGLLQWRKGLEFFESEVERPPGRKLSGLSNIADYKSNPKLFPYCLVTSYFAGAYFGLRQAIEIDSLRYAIDHAPARRRDRYMAALIEAASHCATAPGHFAQFLVPRDKKTLIYVRRIRARSVLERFFDALDSFPNPQCVSRRANRVFNADATTLLYDEATILSKEDLVIYADPPYSRAQYSRYYHLLETMVLYDYPTCDCKGRYRANRVQTDFSLKSKVVDAMSSFAAAAAATGGRLYLSYPRNGLLATIGADVRDVLYPHFTHVSVTAMRPLQHSTMGAAPGVASHRVWEDIFYASN
jgi:adenine-specific DNA-methyltransferase